MTFVDALSPLLAATAVDRVADLVVAHVAAAVAAATTTTTASAVAVAAVAVVVAGDDCDLPGK